nr:MFS transporter [Enemella evansiae]
MNPTKPASPRHPALLLTVLAAAQLLIGLDYNIVFVALPQIAGLGFSAETLQWVVSAYAIAFGGFLLLCGRLVDALGRRRMFLLGLAGYALGSLLGSIAVAEWMLILGRGIQGIGGAALAPATLALLTTSFTEGAPRNRALGIWGAAGSSGMVLGSILGGVLTDLFGWRAVFAINLPLVALVVLLAARSVPVDAHRPHAGRLDLPGAVLTTATAVLVVMGFTFAAEGGWASTAALGTLVAGLVAAAVLLLVERRAADPLLDLRRFRNRHLSTGTASTFLFMAGFGATAYFLTLYFQQVRGLSPFVTGLAFVIPCAGVLIGTTIGGRLATSTGLRDGDAVRSTDRTGRCRPVRRIGAGRDRVAAGARTGRALQHRAGRRLHDHVRHRDHRHRRGRSGHRQRDRHHRSAARRCDRPGGADQCGHRQWGRTAHGRDDRNRRDHWDRDARRADHPGAYADRRRIGHAAAAARTVRRPEPDRLSQTSPAATGRKPATLISIGKAWVAL